MRQAVFIAMVSCFFSLSCTRDRVNEFYTFYRPVYQTKAVVKANIKSDASQPVENPGKLVVKGNYVFLNDIDKGIHIIDISNPSQLKNIAFIHIPGCVDLAIKNDYLYADCYTDLVTIDISNPLDITVKQFLNGVFPHRYYTGFTADTAQVIQQWVRVDTMVSRRFTESVNYQKDFGNVLFFASSAAGGMAGATTAGAGIAGSMARFALMGERMYTVSENDLKVFNIQKPVAPSYTSSVSLQNGMIETIFPYQDKLFIGTQTGMFIYQTNNPDLPQKLSQFTHARSCDPVIADNKYAYVTLRGGSVCGGSSNELDIINIENLLSAKLITSYPLSEPYGLSKDGNILLVCDGADGLKIYNTANLPAIQLVKKISGFNAYDVIAYNGIALLVAKDGLYAIDYSDPLTATVISKIIINPTR